MTTVSAAPDGPIRIGAIDDHPIVLRGVVASLAEIAPDMHVDFIVSSVRDLDWRRVARPDVILLDVDLNDGSTAQANVRELVEIGVAVLLFTATTRPAILRSLIAAGASGLALKSDQETDLADAIRSVANSRFAVSSHLAQALLTDPGIMASLTPRELEVLQLLAAGIPKKAIGRTLDQPLSAATVETYLQRIAARYAALGRPVTNMYGSLREAARDGYVDL